VEVDMDFGILECFKGEADIAGAVFDQQNVERRGDSRN
jgi:hypothetical protein